MLLASHLEISLKLPASFFRGAKFLCHGKDCQLSIQTPDDDDDWTRPVSFQSHTNNGDTRFTCYTCHYSMCSRCVRRGDSAAPRRKPWRRPRSRTAGGSSSRSRSDNSSAVVVAALDDEDEWSSRSVTVTVRIEAVPATAPLLDASSSDRRNETLASAETALTALIDKRKAKVEEEPPPSYEELVKQGTVLC